MDKLDFVRVIWNCCVVIWVRLGRTTPKKRSVRLYGAIELSGGKGKEDISGSLFCAPRRDPAPCARWHQAARRRHPHSSSGAGQWQDENSAAVDLRARRQRLRRHHASSSLVCLHAGPQRRPSANAPGHLQGRATSRCVCRFQCTLRRWHHTGSGVLGACAPQVPRSACSQTIGYHNRGPAPDCRAVCDRGPYTRQTAARTIAGAPAAITTIARRVRQLATRHA
jgi:hypothetical protein